MNKPHIIVVGGGLAGLTATVRVASAGLTVQLITEVPPRFSGFGSTHSETSIFKNLNELKETPVNASSRVHFQETIECGDYLANQELPWQMSLFTPRILSQLKRWGILYDSNQRGLFDLHKASQNNSGLLKDSRSAIGQKILSMMDIEVKRFVEDKVVSLCEDLSFLSIIKNSRGACCGVTAIHLTTMEIKAYPADGVIFCTGGLGHLFGLSTNSKSSTGSAASALYQQGACYANGEFIQFYPLCLWGEDKCHVIPETVLTCGGRLWVYRAFNGGAPKPWYFLEESTPGNNLPISWKFISQSLHRVIYEMGLGINGEPFVYLDLQHLKEEIFEGPLQGFVLTCRKFFGIDPRVSPLKIAPSAHYSLGGLWVDENHMTNIPGLFAAGECDYQYHGADRIPGNSLFSCIFGGIKAGESSVDYAQGSGLAVDGLSPVLFSDEVKRQNDINHSFMDASGNENPYALHDELGYWMRRYLGPVRHDKGMRQTEEKIRELKMRLQRITLADRGSCRNMELLKARSLANMLELALVITKGALNRHESRGTHYRHEFPKRNDPDFLKTTKATYMPEGPKIEYEDVHLKYSKPQKEAKNENDNR